MCVCRIRRGLSVNIRLFARKSCTFTSLFSQKAHTYLYIRALPFTVALLNIPRVENQLSQSSLLAPHRKSPSTSLKGKRSSLYLIIPPPSLYVYFSLSFSLFLCIPLLGFVILLHPLFGLSFSLSYRIQYDFNLHPLSATDNQNAIYLPCYTSL